MNMCELWLIHYTPVGEYIRLLALKRLARGSAKVEVLSLSNFLPPLSSSTASPPITFTT